MTMAMTSITSSSGAGRLTRAAAAALNLMMATLLVLQLMRAGSRRHLHLFMHARHLPARRRLISHPSPSSDDERPIDRDMHPW